MSSAPPPPPDTDTAAAAAVTDYLFPPALLGGPEAQPTAAGADPAEGYTARPLRRSDFARGYVDCLAALTWVGDAFAEEQFLARYDEMDSGGKGPYYLVVIEQRGRIVATGSLIAEKKFIHNCGTIGHIEEISVLPAYQKRKLGKAIIHALTCLAGQIGCYKAILDCGPHNVPFYAKCGYVNAGVEMSRYLDDEGDRRGDYYRG